MNTPIACVPTAILIVMLGAVFQVAGAQDTTTTLPAVIINAVPGPPGAGKISGIVADTGGRRIGGAEISIPDLRRRVFSRADGRFFLDSVPTGRYSVRAKRIGYAPQIRPIVVDSAGGVGAFALVPFPYKLNPVVSSATGGGLAGTVFDVYSRPVAGAEVKAMGHGEHSESDSSGWFFLPIRSGSYTIGVSHDGFTTRLASVIIPEDSGRWLDIQLVARKGKIPVREAWNIPGLEYRLAWRRTSASVVYTRAELMERDIEWVSDAVNMAAGSLGAHYADTDCSAVLNGGPGSINLATLTIDDIELVEIYASGGMSKPTKQRIPGSGRAIITPGKIDNTSAAKMANMSMSCPTTFVWLR